MNHLCPLWQAHVDDVEPASSLLRQEQGAVDRLQLGHGGPGLAPRPPVASPVSLQAAHAVLRDGVALGVHCQELVEITQPLQPVE